MRVAFISLDFLPEQIGGGEVYAFNLASALQSLGHEVVVVRRKRHENPGLTVSETNHRGLRIVALNSNTGPTSAWAIDVEHYKWALQFLSEYRPDVVHVLLFAGMLSVVRAARELGIPIVLTALDFGMFCSNFHLVNEQGALCDGKMEFNKCERCQLASYSPNHQTVYQATKHVPAPLLMGARRVATGFGLRDPLLALDVRRALKSLEQNWSEIDALIDVVIAPSEVMKQMYILNGFPSAKIHSMAYGTTVTRQLKAGRDTAKIRFGYVGRLHPSKGVDLLIEAFTGLDDPEARLLLFGPLPQDEGSDSHFQRLLSLAGNDKRINFKGAISPELISGVHQEVDILVVPSLWYENATITVLESLRCGTPVIVSDVAGITEFVKHGVNGLVFERKNVRSLQNAMRRIRTEPDLLSRLESSANGLPTIENNAHEVLGIYETVMKEHGAFSGKAIARA